MRHCERSEAIHVCAGGQMDCFVASALARRRASADKSAPRNDGEAALFVGCILTQALGSVAPRLEP